MWSNNLRIIIVFESITQPVRYAPLNRRYLNIRIAAHTPLKSRLYVPFLIWYPAHNETLATRLALDENFYSFMFCGCILFC